MVENCFMCTEEQFLDNWTRIKQPCVSAGVNFLQQLKYNGPLDSYWADTRGVICQLTSSKKSYQVLALFLLTA